MASRILRLFDRADFTGGVHANAAHRSLDPSHRPVAGDQHSLTGAVVASLCIDLNFIGIGYFMIQAASDQAFLLMLISICLGACFVWAFWEIEEARQRRLDRVVGEARRSVKPSH